MSGSHDTLLADARTNKFRHVYFALLEEYSRRMPGVYWMSYLDIILRTGRNSSERRLREMREMNLVDWCMIPRRKGCPVVYYRLALYGPGQEYEVDEGWMDEYANMAEKAASLAMLKHARPCHEEGSEQGRFPF